MTEHTPGPWEAFVKHGVICVHLEKDDSPHLTEVISWQGFDSCDIKSHDERVANAYLFAAAPDLLAACEMALHAFEDNWAINWDDLRRAIDKAKGEVT